MADSLKDLLCGRKDTEPPEMSAIKKYVSEQFKAEVGVAYSGKQLVISAPSAALAGTLRLHIHSLQQISGLQQIAIRIAH